MSVRAMTWAWGQHLPAATKLVLMALADHSDDDGECWPGLKGLAEKCRISRRMINVHIATLRTAGLLEVLPQRRPDQSQTSNLYRLLLSNPLHTPLQSTSPTLATSDTPLQSTSPTLEASFNPPLKPASTPLNPHLNRQRLKESPPTPQGVRAKARARPRKEPRAVAITPEFIEEMVLEWSDRLGGEARTRDSIDRALNHKARDKAKNERVYLKLWLRRDAEKYGGGNSEHSRRDGASPPVDPLAKWRAEALRLGQTPESEERALLEYKKMLEEDPNRS